MVFRFLGDNTDGFRSILASHLLAETHGRGSIAVVTVGLPPKDGFLQAEKNTSGHNIYGLYHTIIMFNCPFRFISTCPKSNQECRESRSTKAADAHAMIMRDTSIALLVTLMLRVMQRKILKINMFGSTYCHI